MSDGRTASTTATMDGVAEDAATIDRDGIVGRKGAFERTWVEQLHEDLMTAFWAAIQRPHGTVGRGRRRWYVEVHPEQVRGFVDLVTHPWITGLSEAILGPDYRFVEVGFDVPFQGARDQPWHRDFPSPPETYEGRRLTSLAFNLTAVDTEPDMGPFEIAPGTQWEPGLDFDHQMFPDRSEWPRYEALGQRKYPRRGDVSARSALTIHRGTRNESEKARPVLVLGVDAPGAGHDLLHDPQVTPDYFEALPEPVRRHLHCRVVDELEPIVQKHQIEGLVMGAP
jgi:hypothetical protein